MEKDINNKEPLNNNKKREVKSMWPFGKDTKTQTIFSVVAIMIGIALVLITAPFIVKVGDIKFYSTTLGGILTIIGIVYLLEAQL